MGGQGLMRPLHITVVLYQFTLRIRPQGDNTKISTTSRFGRLPSRRYGHIWPFQDFLSGGVGLGNY
jgi:hypothetical protein